jgi:hypothetical protein
MTTPTLERVRELLDEYQRAASTYDPAAHFGVNPEYADVAMGTAPPSLNWLGLDGAKLLDVVSAEGGEHAALAGRLAAEIRAEALIKSAPKPVGRTPIRAFIESFSQLAVRHDEKALTIRRPGGALGLRDPRGARRVAPGDRCASHRVADAPQSPGGRGTRRHAPLGARGWALEPHRRACPDVAGPHLRCSPMGGVRGPCHDRLLGGSDEHEDGVRSSRCPPHWRRAVAKEVARHSDPAARSRGAWRLVADEDSEVRRLALDALRSRVDGSDVRRLADILAHDPDHEVRASAMNRLYELACEHERHANDVVLIFEGHRDANPSVENSLIRLLAYLKRPPEPRDERERSQLRERLKEAIQRAESLSDFFIRACGARGGPRWAPDSHLAGETNPVVRVLLFDWLATQPAVPRKELRRLHLNETDPAARAAAERALRVPDYPFLG